MACWLVISGPLQAQDTGSLLLLGGVTAPLDPSESARGGVHASMAFVTGRFSLGPEAGWYFTAGNEFSPSSRPENTVILAVWRV
jgi:hypothetical protein